MAKRTKRTPPRSKPGQNLDYAVDPCPPADAAASSNRSKNEGEMEGNKTDESLQFVTIGDGSRVLATDLAHIAPDLWPLAVPIDTLTPDPRNARRHGEKNLAAIRASLRANGQLKAVSTDAAGVILAGNGTCEAALAEGWKYLARARTPLTGAAARAWAIADNRTAELAEWDVNELNAQMQEIEAELGDMKLDLGWSDDELNALADGKFDIAHGFAPKKAKEPPPEGGNEPYDPIFKIVVTCRDEAHQRDLIEQFEKQNLNFTAPSA